MRERHANPPGRDQLAYRTGTAAGFFDVMREALHRRIVRDSDGHPRTPLARLNTDLADRKLGDSEDFGLALLYAWAAACDVFAFYTERIACEGYLRTARDPRSVFELINMLGYEPDPGLAAEAWLVFTLREVQGAPEKVMIPAGLPVNSVPGAGEVPQVFETTTEIEARGRWNLFTAFVETRARLQRIWADMTRLELAGISTGLNPGDPFLITGTRRDRDETPFQMLQKLIKVDLNAKERFTTINWSHDRDEVLRHELIEDSEIYAFTTKAHLFGYDATPWDKVPESTRQKVRPIQGGLYRSVGGGANWMTIQANLPQVTITALAVDRQARIYAGMEGRGIYVSEDAGQSWQERNVGLTSRDVFTLTFDNRGGLLAGTGGGGVFYTRNGAASWEPKKGGFVLDKKGKPKKASLPETAVRCFSVFVGKPGSSFWRKAVNPMTWLGLLNPKKVMGALASIRKLNPADLYKKAADKLKQLIKEELEALRERSRDRAIEELGFADPEMKTYVLAGTDMGVFRTPGTLDGWHPVNEGMPRINDETGTAEVTVNTLVFQDASKQVFAGTDHGIFVSGDLGTSWRPASTGLPRTDRATGWSKTEVLSLESLPREGNRPPRLLAGTVVGVFRSDDLGRSWRASPRGLPRMDPDTGLPATRIEALVRSPAPPHHIYAAGDMGLFITEDAGESWTQLNSHLLVMLFLLRPPSRKEPNTDALCASLDIGRLPESLRVRFRENGVALSDFIRVQPLIKGSRWLLEDDEKATGYIVVRMELVLEVYQRAKQITAMRLDHQGSVLAGVPFSGYEDTEWPELWIQGNQIDLDKTYSEVLPGTLVVLEQDDMVTIREIEDVETVTRRDYDKTGTVTRLLVEGGEELAAFDIRTTRVLLGSNALDRYEPRVETGVPITGTRIEIEGLAHDLPDHRRLIVTGKRKRVRLGRMGGVSCWNGRCWDRIGLANLDVTSLTRDVHGRVLAATSNGIYRMTGTPAAAIWEPIGLQGHSVRVVASDHHTNDLFAAVAGSEEGCLYGFNEEGWKPLSFPGREITAIMVHPEDKREEVPPPNEKEAPLRRRLIIVSTDRDGIFVSLDHGETFTAVNNGLETWRVSCLAILTGSRQTILAGTEKGIYTAGQELFWRPWNEGLDNLEILALEPDEEHGRVYAATPNGAWTAEIGGVWESMNEGLAAPIVTALERVGARIYAGTYGEGVFSLSHATHAWHCLATGLTNDILCLEDGGDGRLLAGGSASTLLLGPQSFERMGRRFLFDLVAHEDSAEQLMDLTAANFKERGIALGKDAVIEVGEEPRSWVITDAGKQIEIFEERGRLAFYQPNQYLMALRAPVERDPRQHWRLVTDEGIEGTLTSYEGEVLLDAAADSDRTVSEVVTLLDTLPSGGHKNATLVFDRALEGYYHAPTVTIHGNVVHATHGQTVRDVLGSGDNTRVNQSFPLHTPPLTYRQMPDGEIENTLEIYTNPDQNTEGVRWEEVTTLYGQPEGKRCYSLHRDGEGKTVAHFGDGTQGARLPTGLENVVATYRRGIGREGLVDADTLLMPQQRPLGVQNVTNPLPAEGAADPEDWETARRRAPIRSRPLERIVSLRDLEDFVLLYPGIGKSIAERVWNGRRSVGHLTFAADDGLPIAPDSLSFTRMYEAVEQASGSMLSGVILASYRPLHFRVEASVVLTESAQRRPVVEEIIARLRETYAFAERDFARAVSQAEVIAAIQGVAGVDAVSLKGLYLAGHQPKARNLLIARGAHWDNKRRQVAPAEILFIPYAHYIQIEVDTS